MVRKVARLEINKLITQIPPVTNFGSCSLLDIFNGHVFVQDHRYAKLTHLTHIVRPFVS